MNDVFEKEPNLHCHSCKTGTKAAKLLQISPLQNMQLTNYRSKTQQRVNYTCPKSNQNLYMYTPTITKSYIFLRHFKILSCDNLYPDLPT